MAFEFVVAGRRPLPIRAKNKQWSYSVEHYIEDTDDDDEDEAVTWDEGGCSIDAMVVEPGEYFDFVARRAGFEPVSIVAISPAAFEFSECAASVIAAALDGVYFCDAIPDRGPWEALGKADAPRTLKELEQRLEGAFQKPREFFDAIAERDRAAAAEWAERNPAQAAAEAAQRKGEDDWSDL